MIEVQNIHGRTKVRQNKVLWRFSLSLSNNVFLYLWQYCTCECTITAVHSTLLNRKPSLKSGNCAKFPFNATLRVTFSTNRGWHSWKIGSRTEMITFSPRIPFLWLAAEQHKVSSNFHKAAASAASSKWAFTVDKANGLAWQLRWIGCMIECCLFTLQRKDCN